jgi:hypothetical protein
MLVVSEKNVSAPQNVELLEVQVTQNHVTYVFRVVKSDPLACGGPPKGPRSSRPTQCGPKAVGTQGSRGRGQAQAVDILFAAQLCRPRAKQSINPICLLRAYVRTRRPAGRRAGGCRFDPIRARCRGSVGRPGSIFAVGSHSGCENL